MQIFPDRETFRRLAARGNLIPVTCRLLADLETPLSAYRKLRGQGESFLFESVEGGEHLGRYSFVGTNPRAVIRQVGSEVRLTEGGRDAGVWRVVGARGRPVAGEVRDGLEVVERVMGRYRPVPLPGLPRFIGGAVGYVGYEFIHDIEPVVPRPARDELGTPTLYLVLADQLLIFDRVKQTLTVLVNAWVEDPAGVDAAYDEAVEEVERLLALLEEPVSHLPALLPETVPPVSFESNMDRETFLGHVRRAKEYIRAGDIIQVVGSQRFRAPVRAGAVEVYRAIRSVNPSPYMFLLELEGFALVGASPEIHVRCEDGRVEIRPIAGTRRRGRTAEEDAALEAELLADPKERAEHVMLVDLARNDLGRVCEYGSVRVKDLMVIERYSHVMHIVSSVEGRLAGGRSPFDLMRATFPAGTVSGAPKIRAMQIIAELEGTTRGPYAGCVGYFGFNGNLDTCITIRTALLKDGHAYVQAGGGWVHDSEPEAEFQETVNKASAMFQAIALAEHFGRGAAEGVPAGRA
ncbi:anthranilate synthase component I [Limisphaera ngatamarikiensis]|jgi:anthranilate synthase component 1|uniref:Anthranilate synthase component 1 n=1 Tax=Limisphaera ngatamarikiensis TaxID=1324935 RepID=A0A6M1S0C3_9BACT|nr:anthranilate synthase component I [Limisphaera ngatamarikiensis]NGO38810.1 anthranilate synthase component I [Limisphaera ngatamarikiensis]